MDERKRRLALQTWSLRFIKITGDKNMLKKESNPEEGACPCGESTCSADCEACQDLPIGYFENRRNEERMREGMPYKKNGMYYCPKCDFHAQNDELVYNHLRNVHVAKS